jgi:hypothetical protein
MKKTHRTLIAIAAILGAVANINAITYDASTDGTTNPAGSFSANGDTLVVDTVYGYTYLGINGGMGGTEIGVDEKLTIGLSQAMKVISITIGLLYDGPEFDDNGEIAAFLKNDAGTAFKLTATGATTATWTGFAGATVTNISPASGGGNGGVWKITNPFENESMSSLGVYPLSTNPDGNDSDFGLVAFEIPDSGATLGLLGLSLISVAFIRRKR